jgi:hypothetical protein
MSLRSSGLRRKEKRKRNAGRRRCLLARTQAACGTRHGKGGLRRPPLAGALACRRSTAVLTSGTFVPKAQHRARLPKNGAKAAACRTHRLGHSDAPRAPVIVPAGMMPEPPGCGVYLSARGRRTRSAFREYPPQRRPLRERDWLRLLPSPRQSQSALNFRR